MLVTTNPKKRIFTTECAEGTEEKAAGLRGLRPALQVFAMWPAVRHFFAFGEADRLTLVCAYVYERAPGLREGGMEGRKGGSMV